MEEHKRTPGRPRKWSSDAERMRAARAAKRETERAEQERAALRRKRTQAARPSSVLNSVEANSAGTMVANPGVASAAGIGAGEAMIQALRDELAQREDLYNDIVLDHWILKQRYEMVLSWMRRCDPEGPAWLERRLGEWQRDVEARRLVGLRDDVRQRMRKLREDEFDRRVQLARREPC